MARQPTPVGLFVHFGLLICFALVSLEVVLRAFVCLMVPLRPIGLAIRWMVRHVAPRPLARLWRSVPVFPRDRPDPRSTTELLARAAEQCAERDTIASAAAACQSRRGVGQMYGDTLPLQPQPWGTHPSQQPKGAKSSLGSASINHRRTHVYGAPLDNPLAFSPASGGAGAGTSTTHHPCQDDKHVIKAPAQENEGHDHDDQTIHEIDERCGNQGDSSVGSIGSVGGGHHIREDESVESLTDSDDLHGRDAAQKTPYTVEEHVVRTRDGFLLVLHRIYRHSLEPPCSVESVSPPTSGRSPHSQTATSGVCDGGCNANLGPPVLLQHGYLMCDEVWVAMAEGDHGGPRCLPMMLADAGYDVWMGNNRGNKYSYKHETYKPTEDRFWDFSIDDLAMFDIPAMIDYILEYTRRPSLSYIGFSQGSAQAFAAFSSSPSLAAKVNIFIALAPAAVVKNFGKVFGEFLIDPLSFASSNVLFALFGKKRMLPMTLIWQRLLTPSIFARIIDTCTYLLFGWNARQISTHDKRRVYQHLYSYSSVKVTIHWIQILRAGRFQMYNDDPGRHLTSSRRGHVPPRYAIRQIGCPVALFHGEGDKLPHIEDIMEELSAHRGCTYRPHARTGLVYHERVPLYEHLDFLWASDVHTKVYPTVINLLNQYTQTSPGGVSPPPPPATPASGSSAHGNAFSDSPAPGQFDSPPPLPTVAVVAPTASRGIGSGVGGSASGRGLASRLMTAVEAVPKHAPSPQVLPAGRSGYEETTGVGMGRRDSGSSLGVKCERAIDAITAISDDQEGSNRHATLKNEGHGRRNSGQSEAAQAPKDPW